MATYDPEKYWSKVGDEIQKRGKNYIAGDDIPYYRYQRKKVLKKFVDSIDFKNYIILEIGFGPGGNLKHILRNHSAQKVLGVDISQTMLELASENLKDYKDNVELFKIDGTTLPFNDKSVDKSFSLTVLHHITEENMLKALIKEMCRVTKKEIILMENIGFSNQIGAEGSFISRNLNIYEELFSENQFKLSGCQYLNTRISRNWYWLLYFGLYKRILNRKHEEGEPISKFIKFLMAFALPLTRFLDRIFKDNKSVAKMIFTPAEY